MPAAVLVLAPARLGGVQLSSRRGCLPLAAFAPGTVALARDPLEALDGGRPGGGTAGGPGVIGWSGSIAARR